MLICPQLIASVEAQVKAQGLSDNKAPQNSLGGGLSCEAWTIAKRCHGMVAWELPRRMYHRCRGLGGQKRTPWRWMVLERDHTLLATPKSVRCWQQGLWVVLERDHTLLATSKSVYVICSTAFYIIGTTMTISSEALFTSESVQLRMIQNWY